MSRTQQVRARARIHLPVEACWEKLRDFERALQYVPGLTDVRITTEARQGVGASRVVVHETTGAMDETISEWREGRGFRIRLHRGERGPMLPLRDAYFDYALEPAGEGECDIVMTMQYSLGLGPIGTLLDALLVRRLLRRTLGDTALALADNYETDQRVGSERLRVLRARVSRGRAGRS